MSKIKVLDLIPSNLKPALIDEIKQLIKEDARFIPTQVPTWVLGKFIANDPRLHGVSEEWLRNLQFPEEELQYDQFVREILKEWGKHKKNTPATQDEIEKILNNII